MADQKITELPIKVVSGINLADYLLGIDAAEGYQMLISDLAKKIIEQYAGSTLAGTAQPIKDALDTVAENAYENMATIESGTTASKAYAVGERMVLDGLLYKVTSAITQGGTITVDSNVTLDALADDVAAVEGKIGNTSISGIGNGTITGALSALNGKFVIDTVTSDSYTIAGNATENISISVTKSGYRAVGVLGVTPLDTAVFAITRFRVYSDTVVSISAYNTISASRASRIFLTVLYIAA